MTTPPLPLFAPAWFDGLQDLAEDDAFDLIEPGTRFVFGPQWLLEAERHVCAISRVDGASPFCVFDAAGAVRGVCASWAGARRVLLAIALDYVTSASSRIHDEGAVFDAAGRARVVEALRRGLTQDILSTFETKFARSVLVRFGAGRDTLSAKQAQVLRTILAKCGEAV